MAHAVHQQPLGQAYLRGSKPDTKGVVHDRAHARHLGAERVVEAVDRSGPALQHGIAVAADEAHRGSTPRGHLRVEMVVFLVCLFRILYDFDWLFGHALRV